VGRDNAGSPRPKTWLNAAVDFRGPLLDSKKTETRTQTMRPFPELDGIIGIVVAAAVFYFSPSAVVSLSEINTTQHVKCQSGKHEGFGRLQPPTSP